MSPLISFDRKYLILRGAVTLVAGEKKPVSVLDMTDREKSSNERRGLASASEETREHASRLGGEASHKDDVKKAPGAGHGGSHGGSKGSEERSNRGLASADEETRERVARAGGEAPHRVRGLQAADEETKERVARAGGEAPHKERGHSASEHDTKKSSSGTRSSSGSRGRD